MKKEEIKQYILKTPEEMVELTFRNGVIKVGHFEESLENEELYMKNQWNFIESTSHKNQLINGNDIILMDKVKKILS